MDVSEGGNEGGGAGEAEAGDAISMGTPSVPAVTTAVAARRITGRVIVLPFLT